MTERLHVNPPLDQEISRNGDTTVLFKIGDLPKTRRHFFRSLFDSPLDFPFDLWGLAIDLQRGGLGLLRERIDSRHLTEGIPFGRGQTLILATGMAGIKKTLEPMGNFLKRFNHEVVYAPYPYGANLEGINKRKQILLKTTREVFRESGKKVNWWLWSKATLEGLMAAMEHPKLIQKWVNHIVLVGIPVKCRLNSAVGMFYLAISNGADFRYRAKYGDGIEVKIPQGVGYTIIESVNNGVCRFANGRFPGTFMVDCGHSELGFHPEVKRITAFRLAGYEPEKVAA